jgi:hypothetical protein
VPSRKQRRRRAKERRHEYEYVYVDEEGREVEVEPDEAARSKRTDRRPSATRGGRKVDPPSWRRVGRRALLFAPLMFITIRLFGGQTSIFGSVVETIFLLLFFLPFSYFMDTVLYRSFSRRADRQS